MNALPFAAFSSQPLRGIRPQGWLLDFLQRQARGLTGHVAVSGYPYGYKFWGTHEDHTQGSYSAWWPYEQTAYWIDGALKCGYLAGEEELYRQALEEIDFAVEHAAPDGYIGPAFLREQDRWPHAVFFRAVLAQYEISGDRRYLDALIRHYQALPHPMGWSRDVSGVEILLALYQECGQPALLDMAGDLYARFNQSFPGLDTATGTLLSEKLPTEHGVTFNEQAKLAAMLYAATGRAELRQASVHGYEKLDRKALLADGLHSCAEHILGSSERDTHETCDITDHTWSLAAMLQVTGEACYADRIEQVIFNALPGAITKDFKALQYFSGVNQIVVTNHSNHNLAMKGWNWMSYRPDHEVQCCPGNLHRAMPNYISMMWLRPASGGIAAALYGPGRLETSVGPEGTPVTITAQTRYPFEEAVTFTLQPGKAAAFPFLLRIPGWCRRAALSLNGQPLEAKCESGTFCAIEREWQPGDVLRLELPFELARHEHPNGGVSLTYGPLTLALPVAAHAEVETENSTTLQRRATLGPTYTPRPAAVRPDFPAWNLTPASPWNYALCLYDPLLKDIQVEWNPACRDPWDAANPPLRVRVPARRVRGWRIVRARKAHQWCHWWQDGHIQRGTRTITGEFEYTPPLPRPASLPARLGSEIEEIELIPYGATLLRMTVFPLACR